MADFHGSSFADKMIGFKGQDNTFSFDSGEFSSLDTITGGSDSAYVDTLEFTGIGQWGLREDIIVSAADFGLVTNIESIALPTNADTSITLPDALIASTNSTDGRVTVDAGTGNDLIDA